MFECISFLDFGCDFEQYGNCPVCLHGWSNVQIENDNWGDGGRNCCRNFSCIQGIKIFCKEFISSTYSAYYKAWPINKNKSVKIVPNPFPSESYEALCAFALIGIWNTRFVATIFILQLFTYILINPSKLSKLVQFSLLLGLNTMASSKLGTLDQFQFKFQTYFQIQSKLQISINEKTFSFTLCLSTLTWQKNVLFPPLVTDR